MMPLRTAGLVAAVVAASPAFAGAPSPADPADAEQVARGAALYAESCASCHGADLEGETPDWRRRKPDGRLPAPPHDAGGHTWHHDDWTLFGVAKYGTREYTGLDIDTDMAGFADRLTDDEIWAILAFIKSHWPDDILRRQTELTRNAAPRRAD